jgi:hypothetical protein
VREATLLKLLLINELGMVQPRTLDWFLELSSNRCTIDDELIHSIDSKQSRHKLVIEGPNCTGTTIDLLRRKIEVLAYMAGIEVDQSIGSFAIPQCPAIEARPKSLTSYLQISLKGHGCPVDGTSRR